MANKKINELPILSALSDDSLIAVGDPATGTLKKMTVGALKIALNADVEYGNRFQEVYFVDAEDNIITKDTTDFNGVRQFNTATGELLLQLGSSDSVPIDPEDPEVPVPVQLDIPWTLGENQPDFLDLDIHFRAPDGSVLSDHYNEGAGLVGDGGIKPTSGQLMRVDLTYGGGLIDGNNNVVAPWDGPVKVTLEIRKNGVWFDGFSRKYPTPPAAGYIGHKFIQPAELDAWSVSARAERYTIPGDDEIGDVQEPPVPIVNVNWAGGSDTIIAGAASVILEGDQSLNTDTYEWSSNDPDITFSAP